MDERPTDFARSPPPRPSPGEERWALRCFLAISPRLNRIEQPPPPDSLRPWEDLLIPRRVGGGEVSATWFPALGTARGAVLLVHPWLPWGKAYFYRRGRLEALRRAGYHALALDLSGFGRSTRTHAFLDRDVETGLALLKERAPGLPLHVWGISSGGYWAHPALARTGEVAGAMFEDVAAHLFEWSWRKSHPLLRPCFLLYRTAFAASYRFLDIRLQAAAFRLGAVTYLSGEKDRGVLPSDTRALAAAAGGEPRIVPRADHLEAIKLVNEEVLALALETFRRGEEAAPRR